MVSIGNFERRLARYIGISGPALDQRDRELRKAGLILRTESGVVPRGRRAISVNASDAAYVILAAASDAGPKDVLERVSTLANLNASFLVLDLEGLYQHEFAPAGFETLHQFLIKAISRPDICRVDRVIIRPHSLSAGSDALVKSDQMEFVGPIEFEAVKNINDSLVAPEDSMQKVFELRGGFFQVVRCLIEGRDPETQRIRVDSRGVPIPDNIL